MVDRENRDSMATALERYLREEIRALDLDEEIQRIADNTCDQTVEELFFLLWHHYDDFKNHAVVATKEEWDFFQRALLVLRSDGRIKGRKLRRFTIRQTIAPATLAVFAVTFARGTVEWGFSPAMVPFATVSIGLFIWRYKAWAWLDRARTPLDPFASVSEILAVRRRVPGFRKVRYPEHLRFREIRSKPASGIQALPFYAAWMFLWLVVSPVSLLFQSLPEGYPLRSVVLDDPAPRSADR